MFATGGGTVFQMHGHLMWLFLAEKRVSGVFG